jgi:hypothetical protein
MEIKLGDKVKDKLSDFKGTVVARAEYLYGCVWLCVIPKELHEGKPVEDVWFDDRRLEVIVSKNMEPIKPKMQEFMHVGRGPMPSSPKPNFPKPNK